MDILTTFKKFLDDTEVDNMFITGMAGTGKTTELDQLVRHCIDNNISYKVCAYTHKAVCVLRDKLSCIDNLSTLHSYLCKRPGINVTARELAHVEINSQRNTPEPVKIIFIDEFSMVGEKDYMSLVDLQYNDDGDVICKIVYLGDLNQLPPVKDVQTIVPGGDYWVKLTKIHRQASDNKLIDNLVALNNYINGRMPEPLEEHEDLVRHIDIATAYKEDTEQDKIILAYTNAQVQALNASLEGKENPEESDIIFSPTTRDMYSLEHILEKGNDFIPSQVHEILTPNLRVITEGTKFKTLETLLSMEEITFMDVVNEEGFYSSRATVFGHGKYQELMQKLGNRAAASNKAIFIKYNMDPKEWANSNWSDPMARERAEAWRNYMAVKECVLCMDFKHAMTVHKSQGSTYRHVYLDSQDIDKCSNRDYQMYLKLMYVGISRASKRVFTN